MTTVVRCLLLIVHQNKRLDQQESDTPPQSTRPCAKKTPKREEMIIFALLPYMQRNDQHFGKIFARSEIIVLKSGSKIDSRLTAAITSDRVEVIEIFFWGEKSEDNPEELYVYADKFNEDILNVVLTGHDIDFSNSNFRGLSTSESAEFLLDEENLNIIKQLTSHGTEMRFRSEEGGTLLHFSVRKRNEPLVRLLLTMGARVDARTKHGWTPLHTAAAGTLSALSASDLEKTANQKSDSCISSLLIKYGANVNACVELEGFEGVTPLHLVLESCYVRFFSEPRNSHLVNYLLDKGASVNANSILGNILQFAVQCDLVVLACVLWHRPDLHNAQNRKTFCDTVKRLGRKSKVVQMLELYGFKLGPDDAQDIDLLFKAIEEEDLDLINDLLSWGAASYYQSQADFTDPDKGNNLVELLLTKAAISNRIKAFKFLLELDDSGSSLSLVSHMSSMDEIDWSRWCNYIFDSGVLHLGPILHALPAEDSWTWVPDYISAIKALNLSVNEALFQDLEQQKDRKQTEDIPACLLEALCSPPTTRLTNQVSVLQKEMIGDSEMSFYDILNKPAPALVRLLKNKTVQYVLERKHYSSIDFYMYRELIEQRFRKAHRRRTLMDKGVKMFDFLFKQTGCPNELPPEIKEVIIDKLNNLELLVLVNVCELPDSEI